MLRWFCGALVLFSISSGASCEEAPADANPLSCAEFRGDASRALAGKPDSMQVNNLLFEAARRGCVSGLDMLWQAGASPLARDREGEGALAIAAKAGRANVVEVLLKADQGTLAGELNRPDVLGSTPLALAAIADRTPVVKLLIEAGADVTIANKQGETALSAAAYNNNFELVELLLAHGARPDTVDVSGKGVICYAAARAGEKIVEKLLEAGVDPNARYRADLTALMWAAGHADNASRPAGVRTVDLLIAHGAKLDLVDDRGQSALMIAASLGHHEIVQSLLKAGADRTLKDKKGRTALDLAVSDEVRAALSAP